MDKLDSYLTKHNYPGKLIVIEGSDGSGKTTQLQLLKKYIDEKKIKTQTVDFPQYYDSFYGKFIARYLRGEFGDLATVNPYLISFPYALDRLTAAKKIYSWLKSGKIVLLNRYTPSNLAHQSSRLEKKEREEYLKWSLEFEYKENKLPPEDLVIFLYVPYKYAQKLMQNSFNATVLGCEQCLACGTLAGAKIPCQAVIALVDVPIMLRNVKAWVEFLKPPALLKLPTTLSVNL